MQLNLSIKINENVSNFRQGLDSSAFFMNSKIFSPEALSLYIRHKIDIY